MLIQEHIYSPFPRLMTRFALSRGPHRCSSLVLEREDLFSRTYIYMVHMYIHTYGARYIMHTLINTLNQLRAGPRQSICCPST